MRADAGCGVSVMIVLRLLAATTGSACAQSKYLRIDCFIRQVQLLEIREHVTIIEQPNCPIARFGNCSRRLREVAY